MWRTILIIVVAILVIGFIAIQSMQASTKWSTGEVVRTPDERFANLPDYPFEPNYVESNGYRIHYVDEGPRDGPVVLLLHGQPSWSYLYRHMIPPLADAGYRVIAPDLVGFGKSDKPVEQSDYSYQMHVDVMTDVVRQLDLTDVTYFGQDWGGLIGLRIVATEPDRFANIMISNTGLPAIGGVRGWLAYPLFKLAVWREGRVDTLEFEDGEFSFAKWVAFSRTTDNFDMQGLFQQATYRELSQNELDGYAAPFPSEEHLAGARAFPYLVPSQLQKNDRVMREIYDTWEKPFLTAFGDSDPVTAGGEKVWQDRVPGAKDQPHFMIENAAHFIQEDTPEALVRGLITLLESAEE